MAAAFEKNSSVRPTERPRIVFSVPAEVSLAIESPATNATTSGRRTNVANPSVIRGTTSPLLSNWAANGTSPASGPRRVISIAPTKKIGTSAIAPSPRKVRRCRSSLYSSQRIIPRRPPSAPGTDPLDSAAPVPVHAPRRPRQPAREPPDPPPQDRRRAGSPLRPFRLIRSYSPQLPTPRLRRSFGRAPAAPLGR